MSDLAKRSFLALAIFVLSACTVQWVSQYDEKTDDAITKLQKTTTGFFEDLKFKSEPDCFYSRNDDAYKAVYVDARALLARTRAVDGGQGLNDRTVFQAEEFIRAFDDIRNTHEKRGDSKCISAPTIENAQLLMDQSLTAMLTLELFKKREFVKGTEKDESAATKGNQNGGNQ